MAFVLAGLAILAPALGGSTQLWAQGVVALGCGLVFLIASPHRSLGPWFNAIFLLIAASSLIAFLPANLFPIPPWRKAIVDLGVHLPGTHSPQPWLSLESGLGLWLGLAWAYYVFSYQWESRARELAWDMFCFGILILAAGLTISFAFRARIPFWPDVPEFGFFPNRNQTSNVLGLGGVMIYANAFHHLQRGHKRGWMWLASLGLICWALILNYSRAGIVLFFVGALVWHLCWLWQPRESVSKVLAWVPLAILVCLFLIAGGETFVRFQRSNEFLTGVENGRALIQRDALELLKTAPALGIGLGNFRSLFTAHRKFFVSAAEAIHPESDWLWVAVELGCIAAFLFLLGVGLWVRQSLPLKRGTWRDMRIAALICGIGFVIHGIFDVSGHRIGALWPALFVAGTAINPENPFRDSRVIAWLFRFVGMVAMATGGWWLCSSLGLKVPATSARVERLVETTASDIAAEDYQTAFDAASTGLTIAPLRWILYYDRGLTAAALHRPRSEVDCDFTIARYLLPNWPQLYLNEGQIWLTNDDPDAAFDVWLEGIHRLDDGPALFADIYGAIRNDPDLRDRWRQLATYCQRCLIVFLQNAEPGEFQIEVSDLLHDDPDLRQFDSDNLKNIFTAWYRNGDKLGLARALQEHPNWQKIAWRELARILADYEDYQQAYETAAKFAPAPELPVVSPGTSVESLALRFHANRNDPGDGMILAEAQAQQGNVDDALATLDVLAAQPKPNPALYLLQARLWSQKANWEKAWQAMAKYLSTSG